MLFAIVAIIGSGCGVSYIAHRLRSHQHQAKALSARNQTVVFGGAFSLVLAVLMIMKNLGIFDMAPFSAVTSGLRDPYVVGVILFGAAVAPLLDDYYHQGNYH